MEAVQWQCFNFFVAIIQNLAFITKTWHSEHCVQIIDNIVLSKLLLLDRGPEDPHKPFTGA